jgi:Protein of unknown function (DUF3276)
LAIEPNLLTQVKMNTMGDNNKIKSTLIYGSNRTYFFDIKTNIEGNKYLVIQENKLNSEQLKVTIGEENIAQFIKALNLLLPEFGLEERLKEYIPMR